MTGSLPLLGIVVVNYGSSALLARHLTALDPAAIPAQVVVVDNATTDAERERVAGLCATHGWELVASPVNVGFGEACNLGAARALAQGCDVVLLLNPDAVLTTAAATALAQRCRAQPDGLVSPVIHRSDGSVWFSGSRLDPRTGRVGRMPGEFRSGRDSWLTGACLATSARMWQRLGGFTGDYFLYWEDIDISRRCVDLGGTLVVADDIVAVHDAGGTQSPADGGRAKSAVYYRYNCRNRLLFGCRHLPTGQLLRWALRTPTESAAVLLRGGRRQFLASPAPLWAGLLGSLSGLALVAGELARRARVTTTRRLTGRAAGSRNPIRSGGPATNRNDAA